MKRLLALLALLPSFVWAVDLCTVVSVGSGDFGSPNVDPGNPATFEPGDALLFYSASRTASATSTTDPTAYTLLKQGDQTGNEVWVKIAGRSENAASISWSGGVGVAYIVAVHNPAGFPNEASILGDSATGNNNLGSMLYQGLSVTQGGGCPFQFARHYTTTGNTNVASSVSVTPGYVAAGYYSRDIANGIVISGQMYVGDATSPDLATSTETIYTNSDTGSAFNRAISFTLLSGDNIPTATFTDLTGQATNTLIQGAAVASSAMDNWTKVTVLAGSDTGCAFSIAGGAYSSSAQYMDVGETIAAEVTSGGGGTTKNCTPAYGDALTAGDTFSVSTNAADSTAPTCSVAPALVTQTATTATISATCADAVDATVTHIIGVVSDGATAPTGAELDACSGGALITSSCAEASQTNGVSQSLVTPSVLTLGTAYDVYHTVKDGSGNYKTVVKVDVTTNTSDETSPILLIDHFTGTDGIDLLTHTPDTNVAGTSYTNPTSGQLYLNTNKVIANAASWYFIDVGVADHVSDIQWTAAAGQTAHNFLRVQDSSNYLFCSASVSAQQISLYYKFSGSTTLLSSASVSLVPGTTYRYTASATPGNVLGCAIDGVELVTVTSSAYEDSTLVGFGASGAATTFNDWYVHKAFDALNSSGYVPDDPSGVLNGLTIGTGSAYWVKPGSDPATICSVYSFYAGGSFYCDPITASISMELLNTTTNALSTIPLVITDPGSGTVAPNITDITDETVLVNVDPGPRDLTLFLSAGQPAPTWSLTVGYNTATGEVCPGRILSPTGIVSGICTVPGTYANTAKALNATGNDTDAFSEVVQGDTTPDPFAYTDITNATGTQTSDPCWTVSGINTTTTVTFASSTGVQYNKNAGSYGTSSTTVVNGDALCMQGTAAAPSISGTLTVGGVPSTWTVVAAVDTDADQITFTAQTNVAPQATVTSNCQTISGLTAGVDIPITLSSGQWSKDCAATSPTYVSSLTGSVRNNDSVGLRHSASSSNGTNTTQTFTYGNRTAQFTSITRLGTLPTCSAIPAVTATVADAYALDLTVYTSDVTQFNVGELPGGITASGAVVSGIFSAATDTPITTTIGGSNAYGSCETSIEFTVNPLLDRQWTPVTKPTSPWTRIPRVNE